MLKQVKYAANSQALNQMNSDCQTVWNTWPFIQLFGMNRHCILFYVTFGSCLEDTNTVHVVPDDILCSHFMNDIKISLSQSYFLFLSVFLCLQRDDGERGPVQRAGILSSSQTAEHQESGQMVPHLEGQAQVMNCETKRRNQIIIVPSLAFLSYIL